MELCTARKFRVKLVFHALFGPDSWRFSAMLASFTFLYKLILNSLPLLPVPDALHFLRSEQQKRIRKLEHDLESGSSLPSPPESGASTGQHTPLLMMQSRSRRERERPSADKPEKERRGSHLSLQSKVMYSRLAGARWHAYLAGAVAGLSVLFEKKSRRITIAQQLFVRCVYHSLAILVSSPDFPPSVQWVTGIMERMESTIRNQDTLWLRDCVHIGVRCSLSLDADLARSFSSSRRCGPIMYSFLMRPEAIPRSYYSWCVCSLWHRPRTRSSGRSRSE